MRNLRSENLKYTSDIAKLSEKCVEAQRRCDIATASEASLKTQLKSAESAIRGLKDDLARTKALVAQARASCATEIRRRDRQIDTLKKQVGEAGRARGVKSNPGVLSITVTGDMVNEERKSPTRGGNTVDEDYSLRSEANSFLASLAQNLSEENEALLKVVQQAKDQLRAMSGWSGEEKEDTGVVKQQGWEEMASELEAVMSHLRTILTNPSFVPIEEVMVREEEIDRLKTGWIKMESRWEDAVHLMDGWRKRMAASGRPIGEEDVRMGLHLSPVRVLDVEETRTARQPGLPAVEEEDEEEDEDVEVVQSPCPSRSSRQMVIDDDEEEEGEEEEDDEEEDEEEEDEEVEEEEVPVEDAYDDGEISGSEDDTAADDDYAIEEPNSQPAGPSITASNDEVRQSVELPPLAEPPQQDPLRNSSSAGNRGLGSFRARQKANNSAAIIGKNPRQPAAAANTEASKSRSSRVTKPPIAQRLRPATIKAAGKPEEQKRIVSTASLDEALLPNSRKETDTVAKTDKPAESSNKSEEHSASQDRPAADSKGKSGNLRSNPRRMPVRLARPRAANKGPQPQPQSRSPSKSAIAAKLAASEKQAEAARVRARLKALRASGGGVQRPAIAPTATEAPKAATTKLAAPAGNSERSPDPVKRDVAPHQDVEKPEKRKRERRAVKVSSRRRSTLSPFELQSLISGNVQ